MSRAHVAAWIVAFAECSVCNVACRHRTDPGVPPASSETSHGERGAAVLPPPELKIADDTPDLLLTWVDAKGDAHLVTKPADVPLEGRDQVRALLSHGELGNGDLFYVVNLTVKGADGTYPLTTRTRSEWDTMIASRRVSAAAPPSEPLAPAPDRGARPAVAVTVIVYGASWCGACHQAMAYLKQRRVPAIEKDVEADPAAQREMQSKLMRAGIRGGGSIPIIDVGGRILVGFDPHAIDAAVRAAIGGATPI